VAGAANPPVHDEETTKPMAKTGILWVAKRTVLVRWRFDDEALGFIGVADDWGVYWRASGVEAMQDFGLFSAKVARRTTYVFHPRQRLALPTEYPRWSLPSPVSEWADEMRRKIPEPLLAALKQAQAEDEAAHWTRRQ
jgi:hypothetical protein